MVTTAKRREYTPKEREFLEDHFSSATDDVYLMKNIPGLTGAVLARVSRAQGSVRDVLLDEFADRKVLAEEEADPIAPAVRAFIKGDIDADKACDWIMDLPIAQGEPDKTKPQESIEKVLDLLLGGKIGQTNAVQALRSLIDRDDRRAKRQAGTLVAAVLRAFGRKPIDMAHAAKLIERILLSFGDDSVKELESTHIVIERQTMLVSKELEDRRIGGSPIEKSTRFVFFDVIDEEGRHCYLRPDAIMASRHADAYIAAMDFVFGTYCDLVEPMKALYKGRFPLEEAEYAIIEGKGKIRLTDCDTEALQKKFRQTYNMDMRTKACDALRAILPLSTLTTVAIHGNGRYFEHALKHCYSSALPEARQLATKMHHALDTVMPTYVKRADVNPYAVGVRDAMQELADELLAGIAPLPHADPVALVDDGAASIARGINAWCGPSPVSEDAVRANLRQERDSRTIADMLFPYAGHPLNQLLGIVRKLPAYACDRIVDTYINERKTRRDRPGRALESGYEFVFDLKTDYGTYKDLERHRMNTQQRQLFTPMLGFVMPEDIVTAGFEDRVQSCVDRMQELYRIIADEFPHEAQYATLHGSEVAWTLATNLRALGHLLELRTTKEGHVSYRKVGQKMHLRISDVSTIAAKATGFVDHNMYSSARADSLARQSIKETKLDAKYRTDAT